MKHLSKKQKERRLRHQQALLRRKRRERLRTISKKRKTKRVSRPDQVVLTAPLIFDIENDKNRRPLIRFLKKLRNHFKHHAGKRLLINFQNTRQFVSAGTLLFYAELCRLSKYRPATQIRCNEPRNDRAKQVLQQIGVYWICHHPYHGKTSHRDVVHWQVAQGHRVDANQYAGAIEAHEGRLAEPLVNGIFRGLAEAMANACEHAYTEQRLDSLEYDSPCDWWVFSQEKDGHLYVALCDLGVGIPSTLPRTNQGLFDKLRQALGNPNDGACLSAAIDDSRSRTGRPERGKGLGNIIQAVSDAPDGLAMVFSNRGWYKLRSGAEASGNYPDSILGTLIYWEVPTHEKYQYKQHKNEHGDN
jgi:hypothetical protein